MIIKSGSTDTWNNIIYKLNWKIKEVVFWIKFKRENINIIYHGSPWITVFAQKSNLEGIQKICFDNMLLLLSRFSRVRLCATP